MREVPESGAVEGGEGREFGSWAELEDSGWVESSRPGIHLERVWREPVSGKYVVAQMPDGIEDTEWNRAFREAQARIAWVNAHNEAGS